MISNEPSSEFREELREYLREIGVIKNTVAGSFAGALVRQARENKMAERLYVFLKENDMLEYYRKHEEIILLNFDGLF